MRSNRVNFPLRRKYGMQTCNEGVDQGIEEEREDKGAPKEGGERG